MNDYKLAASRYGAASPFNKTLTLSKLNQTKKMKTKLNKNNQGFTLLEFMSVAGFFTAIVVAGCLVGVGIAFLVHYFSIPAH
jgi:hypothetical protein